MKSFSTLLRSCAATLFVSSAFSQSIPEINGNAFISPYNNLPVSNVSGIVTARGPDGFWLRSTTPDNDPRTSNSIYVFGRTVNVTVGHTITIDGRVSEYKSNKDYITLAEITNPTNVRVIATNATVTPLDISSQGLLPPTEQFTSLDGGDVFGLPNNRSLISAANPKLEPTKYGLDFMESLLGELVTIKSPIAITKPNQFGDTWVVGSWPTTGRNSRGGLTITDNDANPEAIMIGTPLDGSDNPQSTKLGDTLAPITGVVYQAFGTYRILPTTALRTTSSRSPLTPPPPSFPSSNTCSSLSIAQYNVENLSPSSDHLPAIASHIVTALSTPSLLFLQEIQDSSGPTNDNTTSANLTLSTLSSAITSLSPTTSYSYTEIAPLNNADGGAPGGNIRVAYLYELQNPSTLTLAPSTLNTTGSATDACELTANGTLNFNPCRIFPQDPAWDESRKPLVAKWTTITDSGAGEFWTINVHFSSKGGSSPLEGDARPPVNGALAARAAQLSLTAAFVRSILAQDPDANVVVAGDFNEFSFMGPMREFVKQSGGLVDVDDVVGMEEVERYSYLFDMYCQELDHLFVSPAVARKGRRGGVRYEHVHVNTWVEYAEQASDHDPAVGVFDLCWGGGGGGEGGGPGEPPGGGPGKPPGGGPGGPGDGGEGGGKPGNGGQGGQGSDKPGNGQPWTDDEDVPGQPGKPNHNDAGKPGNGGGSGGGSGGSTPGQPGHDLPSNDKPSAPSHHGAPTPDEPGKPDDNHSLPGQAGNAGQDATQHDWADATASGEDAGDNTKQPQKGGKPATAEEEKEGKVCSVVTVTKTAKTGWETYSWFA